MANEIEYPEHLQALLEKIMGNKNVYYQPPSDKKLTYPCIIYQLDGVKSKYAGNLPYNNAKRYAITYISRLPDMFVPDKIAMLPTSSFNRFYISENLNHYVYRIYFDDSPNNPTNLKEETNYV